jgi:hypothetical protein
MNVTIEILLSLIRSTGHAKFEEESAAFRDDVVKSLASLPTQTKQNPCQAV